jgi:hypothetical protein
MCWNLEVSAAISIFGFLTILYLVIKKYPLALIIPLTYFLLMEGLQALTYGVIDRCDLPINQIYTLLGYFHISFQPFFVNMLSLYFIPQYISRKIYLLVYTLCGISAALMLLDVYPFSWAEKCLPSRPLCGETLCSLHGNWHIAWSIPLRFSWHTNITTTFSAFMLNPYTLTVFVLPILYGSYRFTIFHIIFGPSLAYLLTKNMNEWPAIWCLISLYLILLAISTPFRSFMHVKSWFWWPLMNKNKN